MQKLLIALLVFISLGSFAQNHKTDSLKRLLHTEIADTTRVKVLYKLALGYCYSNPDTALIFSQQGLALARQKKFVPGECIHLVSHGIIFWIMGNFPRSLDYYLQALKKYESLGKQDGIMYAIGCIGTVYGELGDDQMAINYYMKCKTIAESINNQNTLNSMLINLGDSYERLNQLDSARMYTNEAYELALRLNNTAVRSTALNNLGNIHSKMHLDEIAMGYYRQSFPLEKEVSDFDALCETTLGMASLFKKSGQADSSLHYARLSYTTALEAGFTKRVLDASTFLSAYFKDMNLVDSAYYYQGITITAKDSLFSQEKTREVQNISFTEKIRQQEIEEANRLAREERKSNIQLFGIVTFISFFFGLLFVFSKRHVNPKVIKFLGVLGLLLLFEFISLFMHPYIASLTHHTPVYMLLILVVIASLLVPMHHKLQHWVTEKLTQKSLKQSSEDEMQLSEPLTDKDNPT
jgi:tetratricopeptide (TPR) repeat protein